MHKTVQPGYFYDFPEGEHLVASLPPPEHEFAQGMSRMAETIIARDLRAGRRLR
jgi:hypothetical protein